MGKLRTVGAVVLAPLMIAALLFAGVSAVLGGLWSIVALDKAARKKAAIEAAVTAMMRGAKEME